MSSLFTADDDLELKRSDCFKIAQELGELEELVKNRVSESN